MALYDLDVDDVSYPDNANPTPPFSLPGYVNDVFSTVSGVASDYFKMRNTQVAQQQTFDLARIKLANEARRDQLVASSAAPGALASWFGNPLPGLFSSTPRADTLPSYDAPSSGFNPVTLIVMAIIAIVVIAFARR